MAMGTVWGTGTWAADTWVDGSWADAVVAYVGTASDFYNTYIQYEEWKVVDEEEVLKKKEITVQLVTYTGVYLDALGGYMAHRLDEHDPATNKVDFNLQQAYKMVIMTVADKAALPTTGIAVGQPCWCTSEKTLHICTSAS